MKKILFVSLFSSIAIFNFSCDAETIAALTEAASSFLEKTPGCMQVGNDKFNLEATEHVQDSCAVQSYGCMDGGTTDFTTVFGDAPDGKTALNYDATATDMCQIIAASLCCTAEVTGCTDAAATNYNALANTHDATACTFNASGSGCLVTTACNYSLVAGYTKDCNGVESGSGTDCCTMPSTASQTCYLDLDNNGFAEVTDSVPAGTCGGCSSKGIGWTDTVNGTEALGCTDPTCIEFNPSATINNGLCCLTDLDSLVESGFTEFTTDSSYFEGAEYALLGEYQMSFSSSCQQGDMSEGDSEIGTIWLGWGGIYFQEFEHSHVISGYPVEPEWNMADNFNACEAAAAVQGAPFFCANEMSNFDDFTPCTEVYYEGECWNNGECSWQYAECRDKPDPTMQACDGATSQGACTAPGCHWEDGNYFDPETGQESQFSEPYCYFDCWNVDETGCNTLNASGSGKCEWKVDQNAGGGWSFCAASAATNPGLCAQTNGIFQQSNDINGDCWWEPDDWDNFGGSGNCSCWIDGVPLFAASVCDNHTSDNSCWNDWEHGCEWDYMEDDCFQPDWFSGTAAGGCWDNNKAECDDTCEWFSPPMPPNAPDWAEDGACMFWDPCHYDENMGSGWNNKQDCQSDWNCYWSEGQGNEASGCWENAYEQYCDCRIDWSSTSCGLAGYTWESFGNFGGQCTMPIDEWTCYGGNFNQGEGYIDCDAYHDADVQRFQVWDGTNCVEVRSENMQGEWYIENNQLCHDKDEMDTECGAINAYAECECMPNCMWQGDGNDPQSWENNGSCAEFDSNQQPRSISVSENPRINGNNKMFHDTPLLEMLYSLNSSSSPPDYECLDYTIDTTPGNVGNIIMSQPDGCVVTLILQQ